MRLEALCSKIVRTALLFGWFLLVLVCWFCAMVAPFLARLLLSLPAKT